MKPHSDKKLFVDVATARQVLTELYPNANSIKLVESGYDNIVGLVDEKYTLRFPRNEEARARNLYEVNILKHIQGIRVPHVPQVLSEHVEPQYLLMTYVPGEHLSTAGLLALPLDQQTEVAQELARFMYLLHTTLAVADVVTAHEQSDPGDEEWNDYLRKTLGEQTLPLPAQDVLAKTYYERWKGCKSSHHAVAVHDDLHMDNLLFEGNHLSGVIDFGDTKVGVVEQELRQLFRVGDHVLDDAIVEYSRLSGLPIDKESVAVWAIVQELAAYSLRYFRGDTDHPGFVRSCGYLNTWLPEVEWGK